MDLRIKMALLPFVDLRFYFKDYIADIGKQESTAEYREYMGQFLEELLPALNQTERIQHIDEIGLLAEKYYPHSFMNQCTSFGERPERFYLERLKELSDLFLTHRNGKVALKYWESTDEKRNANSLFSVYNGIYKVALWNSMNRMICTDLLVMVYLLSNGMTDENVLRAYHSLVYLPDTQLDRVLDAGVAETHLHLSAAGQFIVNWQVLMSPTPKSRDKGVIQHHTYIDQLTGKRADLQVYTLAVAILRIVLAGYLQNMQLKATKTEISIDDYLKAMFKGERQPERELGALIRHLFHGNDLVQQGYDTSRLYFLFEEAKVLIYSVERKDLYNPTWSQRMAAEDSLSRIFGMGVTYTSLENIFMFRALRYMMVEHQEDAVFSRLFWQYIRVKNEQFSRSVQRNHIRGLPYFKDIFEKGTAPQVSQDDVENWGYLLHLQLQNNHMHKLEVRVAPPAKGNASEMKRSFALKVKNLLTAYKEIIGELQRSAPDRRVSLIGLVIHFIKNPDMQKQEKCWFDYNELERNSEKLNFKNKQLEYIRQMKVIRELREEIPGLADYIVGIDAANVETHVEPWVFAPVFRESRNSNTHRLVYDEVPYKHIRNLGLTYHVGEDFRHMLTGLRHLDEVIEHFQFRAGDRIGHGMVLGVEASKWAARNRVVILPRIEMLENWLWIWGMCRAGILLNLDSAYLENKIMQLAEAIYLSLNGITVYSLWKSYQSKFTEIGTASACMGAEHKENWFKEQHKIEIQWTTEMLKSTYHCSCYLLRMREPIELEITGEEEQLIKYVQQIVLTKVSKEGIVIETNPTSNTAIGEIESIFEHYIHNLNRRGLVTDPAMEKGVMVTINTDDPVVFNTNIDNEFAYIFYSLQEKGYAREDILQWIDHVRQTGLTSSFIQNRNLTATAIMEELTGILTDLQDYV